MNNQLSNEQKLKIIHDYCEEHPELRDVVEQTMKLDETKTSDKNILIEQMFHQLVNDMHNSIKKV